MSYESRLPLTIDTDLDLSQRKTIAHALDLLGSALADHGHEWTDEERQAYEDAFRDLWGLEVQRDQNRPLVAVNHRASPSMTDILGHLRRCQDETASLRKENDEMSAKMRLEELAGLRQKVVEAQEAEKKAADDFRHKRECREKAEKNLEKAISASLG